MTRLHELADLGQAVWFDFIRRSFTESGKLGDLIDRGVRGVTSNPTIFEKAIAGSADYDADLRRLIDGGRSLDEIYETLVVEDIRAAAALLRPLYDATATGDGYVSLEVNPNLAHDSDGTIEEARRLFALVAQPNVMIKVPATPAGVPAIKALIGEGINVNVTLIFSLAQYEAVAEAYVAGLERLTVAGGGLHTVASVASFFVSRVDTVVDAALAEAGSQELQGRIAIDNAKVAYARFRELFSGSRWQALAARGAHPQRPLWASTGTKNPAYSDTLYVDSLIGPDTVNTVPPDTLQAFLDHGHVAATIDTDLDGARARLQRLAALGIDLEAIAGELQDAGVASFTESFTSLMAGIGAKREQLLV